MRLTNSRFKGETIFDFARLNDADCSGIDVQTHLVRFKEAHFSNVPDFRASKFAVVWSCVDAPVDARDLLTAPAMIGCGHVSGLEVRLCHMPRAGMEIRRPGADQKSER